MKIAINTSLLYDAHLRGWNRYTVSLIEGLIQKNIELFLYSRRGIHSDFKKRFGEESITYRSDETANYFTWEQFVLPKWCKEDKVDILHAPANYGLPFFKTPCQKILTLHDAIEEKYYAPLESFTSKFSFSSLKSQILQKSAPRNADHIITVSNHAKSDIKEIFKVPSNKISVTYEAHPKSFEKKLDTEVIDKTLLKYGVRFPYFFYIGGFEGRKNINFLLKAFAAASAGGTHLVLAGGGDHSHLKKMIKNLNIQNTVHFTGYVADEDLPALYQGAEAFVYPSFYEGFGLQVCEALISGCPTLVANRTSLPEIMDDGGLGFNLEDTSELSDYLTKLCSDPTFKNELAQKAFERSQFFSWDKTTEQTIEIYKSLINKKN